MDMKRVAKAAHQEAVLVRDMFRSNREAFANVRCGFFPDPIRDLTLCEDHTRDTFDYPTSRNGATAAQ